MVGKEKFHSGVKSLLRDLTAVIPSNCKHSWLVNNLAMFFSRDTCLECLLYRFEPGNAFLVDLTWKNQKTFTVVQGAPFDAVLVVWLLPPVLVLHSIHESTCHEQEWDKVWTLVSSSESKVILKYHVSFIPTALQKNKFIFLLYICCIHYIPTSTIKLRQIIPWNEYLAQKP